jgi:hypothetical protein
MAFWHPPEGSDHDPTWWHVLERVALLSRESESVLTFAACEFMFMGREDRRRRRIWLYKHVATRRYINLDDEGHAYRYVAPADLSKDGRYIAHRRLRDAVDHLEVDLVDTAWRYERCRGCPQCGSTVFPYSPHGTLIH